MLQGKWVFCKAICSVYKEWLIAIIWAKKSMVETMFNITCSSLCLPDTYLPHRCLWKLLYLVSKQLKRFFGPAIHKQGDPLERHCFACIWCAVLCLNPIVCWGFSHQIKLSMLFCMCSSLIKVVSGWNSRYADISIPTACIIAVICFPFG